MKSSAIFVIPLMFILVMVILVCYLVMAVTVLCRQSIGCDLHGVLVGKLSFSTTPMDADSDVALDILITNVVCVFRTRCHLNLRKIALEGANVIYKRDVGKVLMKLRKPRITATIWSSGKIICTGATSEEEAKFGARRLARSLQKLGFQVIFTDFRVVNVLAVCNMPFEIRLPEFTKKNRPHASYEPELHPAVCYRIKTLRATLQIFSTGSITVTGPSVKAVATAVEQIYPFVFESRK